jgi:hypothetical protein
MKTLGLTIGLVFTSFVATAQKNERVNITLIIENVLSNEGKILGSLHSEKHS